MVDTNGRLFTFGCSMTQYNWPTWADLAGSQWEEFQNLGEPGAGNHFIFYSVIECDIVNKFTSNDTVVIMWSGPARHDFYSGNRWGHVSNIFNTDNNIAHCPDGYWLDTFCFIHATCEILDNRKIPYMMLSWIDYTKLDSKFHKKYKNLLQKIKYIKISNKLNLVPKISNIDKLMQVLYEAMHGPDWPSLENIKNNQYSTTPEIQEEIKIFWQNLKKDNRANVASMEMDGHPLPGEHLNMAKKIFPKLKFGTDIEEWVKLLDTSLKNGQSVTGEKL
jgi:hypothetical protein